MIQNKNSWIIYFLLHGIGTKQLEHCELNMRVNKIINRRHYIRPFR